MGCSRAVDAKEWLSGAGCPRVAARQPLRLWQPPHGRPTAQARHNRLCVVNPVGRLVGIITSSDIVRLALAEEASV